MNLAQRIWHELTRPRGQSKRRYYRGGRQSRSGVALLMVITSLMFITIIGTEMTKGGIVRLRLAANQRDEAKAEALAETGFQMYRLILVASKGMGQQLGPMLQQFGMTGELWQMMPFINTGMMRMLLSAGSSPDEDDVEQFAVEGLTDEQIAESREEGQGTTKRNFLDFDGDFFAEVTDENSRIYVGAFRATTYADMLEDPVALRLYGLMSGVDNDQFFYDQNIDRWELIGNLADWTDVDDMRLYQGGSEISVYDRLDEPYRPKNAGFESMSEIRLVDGWHRDDIWEKFGEQLTIYGNGQVNINSATPEVISALLRAYVTPNNPDYIRTLLAEISLYQSISPYTNGQGFVTHLESLGATVNPELQRAVGTESNVFHLTSTGQVGEAVVTIDAIVDFSNSPIGEIVYWRIL